ncbi:MAG: sugar ABC transporter permease [Fibrobacterota bacterium]|nr:sugar ABC transporter permease [Fibrobacterota bacterium]QQS05625.1 MAG: sugar ABC transporter permease [Fibrobacterota bacterium]
MIHRLWRPIRQYRVAWGFLLPAILGMFLVHFLPLVQLVGISFLDSRRTNLGLGLSAPAVGEGTGILGNYVSILSEKSDPFHLGLMDAVWNTCIFTVVVTLSSFLLGLLGALLLEKVGRGRGFWQALLVAPWIVPAYVVGLVWGVFWQQDSGVVNQTLHAVGLLGEDHSTWPMWLSGSLTRWALILPAVWREWPYALLLFSLGLQAIPPQIHEAAKLDGAGGWLRFKKITMPLLTPAASLVLLHGVVYNVYSFNLPLMMFGAGSGNGGKQGDLLMPTIFRNTFQRWDFGRGAAATVVLMVVMLFLVALWYRVFRSDLEKLR